MWPTDIFTQLSKFKLNIIVGYFIVAVPTYIKTCIVLFQLYYYVCVWFII